MAAASFSIELRSRAKFRSPLSLQPRHLAGTVGKGMVPDRRHFARSNASTRRLAIKLDRPKSWLIAAAAYADGPVQPCGCRLRSVTCNRPRAGDARAAKPRTAFSWGKVRAVYRPPSNKVLTQPDLGDRNLPCWEPATATRRDRDCHHCSTGRLQINSHYYAAILKKIFRWISRRPDLQPISGAARVVGQDRHQHTAKTFYRARASIPDIDCRRPTSLPISGVIRLALASCGLRIPITRSSKSSAYSFPAQPLRDVQCTPSNAGRWSMSGRSWPFNDERADRIQPTRLTFSSTSSGHSAGNRLTDLRRVSRRPFRSRRGEAGWHGSSYSSIIPADT